MVSAPLKSVTDYCKKEVMAYSSSGNKPLESASKSNHIHLIKDPVVQDFLLNHIILNRGDDFSVDRKLLVPLNPLASDNVEFVVAIDGGRTEVPVKAKFPSSTITFYQFGANLLSVSDLRKLKDIPFISPDDISKLKELQRIKFALPTKNIGLGKNDGTRFSLTDSVRIAVYNFFKENNLLNTLKWFLFEEYKGAPTEEWILASHPKQSNNKNIAFKRRELDREFKQADSAGILYLTDVFRFHEVVDEEVGAGGILGYIQNLFEHFILINTIRGIVKRRKDALSKVLFIKDGPLGFFGQTANLQIPMRNLVKHLNEIANIYLVGAEKSGPFVDHASYISTLLPEGHAFLLSNEYIYKYIKPGQANELSPYGSSSYYSGKIIYKSSSSGMYVLTIPTLDSKSILTPNSSDYLGLTVILKYIDILKSDMYDNALLPIALVNKLVSLSDHPSSVILEKFAKKSIL